MCLVQLKNFCIFIYAGYLAKVDYKRIFGSELHNKEFSEQKLL